MLVCLIHVLPPNTAHREVAFEDPLELRVDARRAKLIADEHCTLPRTSFALAWGRGMPPAAQSRFTRDARFAKARATV